MHLHLKSAPITRGSRYSAESSHFQSKSRENRVSGESDHILSRSVVLGSQVDLGGGDEDEDEDGGEDYVNDDGTGSRDLEKADLEFVPSPRTQSRSVQSRSLYRSLEPPLSSFQEEAPPRPGESAERLGDPGPAPGDASDGPTPSVGASEADDNGDFKGSFTLEPTPTQEIIVGTWQRRADRRSAYNRSRASRSDEGSSAGGGGNSRAFPHGRSRGGDGAVGGQEVDEEEEEAALVEYYKHLGVESATATDAFWEARRLAKAARLASVKRPNERPPPFSKATAAAAGSIGGQPLKGTLLGPKPPFLLGKAEAFPSEKGPPSALKLSTGPVDGVTSALLGKTRQQQVRLVSHQWRRKQAKAANLPAPPPTVVKDDKLVRRRPQSAGAVPRRRGESPFQFQRNPVPTEGPLLSPGGQQQVSYKPFDKPRPKSAGYQKSQQRKNDPYQKYLRNGGC